ncbi:submandibular gland secretory Glx-rich protein CB-like [Gouania willdenowi]|uniref:submandibular gland secretory Glx-rich protein CB-like n=1 Tax=Gouania willdenowi TaxID=441366 RepID=UPI0010554DA9|nr:submandibular gland secretory Glx-rich protein CB-like [Gouania willdenowi]
MSRPFAKRFVESSSEDEQQQNMSRPFAKRFVESSSEDEQQHQQQKMRRFQRIEESSEDEQQPQQHKMTRSLHSSSTEISSQDEQVTRIPPCSSTENSSEDEQFSEDQEVWSENEDRENPEETGGCEPHAIITFLLLLLAKWKSFFTVSDRAFESVLKIFRIMFNVLSSTFIFTPALQNIAAHFPATLYMFKKAISVNGNDFTSFVRVTFQLQGKLEVFSAIWQIWVAASA